MSENVGRIAEAWSEASRAAAAVARRRKAGSLRDVPHFKPVKVSVGHSVLSTLDETPGRVTKVEGNKHHVSFDDGTYAVLSPKHFGEGDYGTTYAHVGEVVKRAPSKAEQTEALRQQSARALRGHHVGGWVEEKWSPKARAAAAEARRRHGKFKSLGPIFKDGMMPGTRTYIYKAKHRPEVAQIPEGSVVHYDHGGERVKGLLDSHGPDGRGYVNVQTGPKTVKKIAHSRVHGFQAPLPEKGSGRSADVIKAELDDHIKKTSNVPPSHKRYKAVSAKRVALQHELKAAQGSK